MQVMSKTFNAKLSALPSMLDWIRIRLEKAGFSDVEIRRIEIALEEGLVNIISYAYQGEAGTIEISIDHFDGEYIEITLKDHGLPFNPLKQKKEVDPLIPVEVMKVGGLGILFMQKLMDKVEYIRHHNANILSLRKNLS